MALVHYKGKIGKFDYDDTMWKIANGHLVCLDTVNDMSVINVPSGIVNCEGLFAGHGLDENRRVFTKKVTVVFDKNVTVRSCKKMFYLCSFTKGAVIRGLATCKSTYLSYMFCGNLDNGTIVVEEELIGYGNSILGNFLRSISVKLTLNTFVNCVPFAGATLFTEDLSKISAIGDDYNRIFRGAYLGKEDAFIFNKPAVSLEGAFEFLGESPEKYCEIHLNPSDRAYRDQKFNASEMFVFSDMYDLELFDLHLDLDELKCSQSFLDSIKLNGMFTCESEDESITLIKLPDFMHFSEEFFSLSDLQIRSMFQLPGYNDSLSSILKKNRSRIPSYIRVTDDAKDLLRQFNDAYEQHVKGSANSTIEELCKRDLQKLLKEGRSIKEASLILSTMYQSIDLGAMVNAIYDSLHNGCMDAVDKLSVIPSGSSQCRYSIGELRRKLREAGYPGDIVDGCILKLLDDQYISL